MEADYSDIESWNYNFNDQSLSPKLVEDGDENSIHKSCDTGSTFTEVSDNNTVCKRAIGVKCEDACQNKSLGISYSSVNNEHQNMLQTAPCINKINDVHENETANTAENAGEIEVVFDSSFQKNNSENDQIMPVEIADVECVIVSDVFEEIPGSSKSIEKVDTDIHKLTCDTDVCEDIDISDNIYEDNGFPDIYDLSEVPCQITGSFSEFRSMSSNNFTKGCKWAPDGSCILTCSDDNILRIFNLPPQLWDSSQWHEISELEAVVKISEGDLIYDYLWYPLMNSNDPSTCCLASSSRKSTVHLWDGFTGELRCSYRAFNHLDEIVTPYSLSFDSDGQRLFCGFKNIVRVFDVQSPGRNFEERYVYAKKSGQSGIISCFAFSPVDKNVSVAGSYDKTIGIYSEPSGELECLLQGQKNGITQLKFSPDGTYLFSGGRKDPEILCWDMRNLGTVLFSLKRSCVTNQRMYFDISRCGKYVVSGNHNGIITFWDVTKEPEELAKEDFYVLKPIQFYLAHNDCVNGVSLHPTYPLLCSSSGQRKFPMLLDDDEDEAMFSSKIDKQDNSLRLWWLGKTG